MQSRKRIIIISVIVFSLALIILLSSTIFTLKSVSVECRTTTLYLTESDYGAIIDSGEFSYGKNIFFIKVDESKQKIEKAHPYVKVINIERKFPNYAVINIEERIPVVRVSSEGGMYVLDDDLKILNIAYNNNDYISSTNEVKTPILSINGNANITYNTSQEKGTFLVCEKLQQVVNCLFNGIVTKDAETGFPISMISTIASINIVFVAELNSYRFDISFSDTSSTAEIYDGTDLTDRFYTIYQLYNRYSNTYSKYRCSVSGTFTGDNSALNG